MAAPPPIAPADRVVVDRVVAATRAEGPGLRTALWVRGCALRCPGCFNPHLWSPRGGTARRPPDLATELVALAGGAGAEGITLLGGEPFEQAGPLAEVAARVRAAGLSVMTFTGHELGDLRSWAGERPDLAALLAATDLLVDGPYDAARVDRGRPWVGSTNQRFHALSDRYAGLLDRLGGTPDRLEVRVGADGTVAVNGWADDDTLDRLLHGLGRRRR